MLRLGSAALAPDRSHQTPRGNADELVDDVLPESRADKWFLHLDPCRVETGHKPIGGVDPERLPKIGWAVEALTASDQRRADTTHAAEAVSWLTHLEIATAAVNTISALLHKWESEQECTGPAREDEDECQE